MVSLHRVHSVIANKYFKHVDFSQPEDRLFVRVMKLDPTLRLSRADQHLSFLILMHRLLLDILDM